MKLEDSQPRPDEASPGSQPELEAVRLNVLESYDFPNLQDDPELEKITHFAARLCATRMSFVSLVDDTRQHFIASEGLNSEGTPREQSFCAHAMLGNEIMEVPDALQDERFLDNPLVTGEPGIRFYAGAPLISSDGHPLGSLCVIDTATRPAGLSDFQREGLEVLSQAVMRRLTARRELLVRERRTARVADHIPDILWSCDAHDNFDYYNRRWKEFTGAEPPTTSEGWRHLIHEDDQDEAFGNWAKAIERGEPFESEYRFCANGEEWRWVISRALPLKGPDGKVVRWFGTITDVHDAREISEQRDMLARELSHRIKNIFAVMGGLVQLKSRNHPEASLFAKEFGAAVDALNRAHEYVRPGGTPSDDSLHGLLGELASPYTVARPEAVRIEGEDVPVGNKAATPLALIFHELATNSAKYGALLADGGCVAIQTGVSDDMVRVEWTESGGPDASEPDEDGFGSRLIRMTAEGQLGGTFEREFRKEGFHAVIELPRSAL